MVKTLSDRNGRPTIPHVVLVEGKNDRNRVLEAVRADVLTTGGEALTESMVQTIRRLHERRGVIVLTDPDGPGGRIRRALTRAIPDLYHAYVPSHAAKRQGKIGIEHANLSVIREALLHPIQGGHPRNEGSPQYALLHHRPADTASPEEEKTTDSMLTWQAFQAMGLVGEDFSRDLRLKVGDMLGIGYGNAKQFYRLLQLFNIDEEKLSHAIKVAR
ncbi:MAG: Ribonuclease M5 [Candidatus Carbobacillus altaicus]|uniref:Ribonuclease M5 n=1 Tax=Candidatus Carbonibacillus altaicus TaxID=2163959 RepID=A0A2R6XYL3_9BACL|nr:MAG: Ribonuclease M5 [Candidatus Carbobacillus altaicus]